MAEDLKVFVKPTDLWQFFKSHGGDLEDEMIRIAQNEKTGFQLYLEKLNDLPNLVVYDGEAEYPLYEEQCVSETDTVVSVSTVLQKYLASPEDDEKEKADKEMTQDEEILFREDELNGAFDDFLSICLEATDLDDYLSARERDEALHDFLTMLYEKYGISVYRPMYFEKADGTECIVEYPYEDEEIPAEEPKKS